MTEEQRDCGLRIADRGLTQTNGTNPQSDRQNPEADDEAAAAAPSTEEDRAPEETPDNPPHEGQETAQDVAKLPVVLPETAQEMSDPATQDRVAEETGGNPPDEEPEPAPEPAEVPVVPAETTPEMGEPAPQDEVAEGAEQEPEAATPENPQSAIRNPQSELPNPQSETPTVESVIEAILFATDEPLTDGKLASIVETTAKQVRESVESLNAKYAANHSAFRIEQIAGGYQMLTLNLYNPWLKKMLRARSDSKLSPAAMETLAIIAYKQPIIRADIEAIRGVAVGEVIRSLMYKGLVKIAGRAEILGRPMLYGTTKKFLEVFGLNSLKDLPKAEELKDPDRQ
jgi:segregation and condensation protein B